MSSLSVEASQRVSLALSPCFVCWVICMDYSVDTISQEYGLKALIGICRIGYPSKVCTLKTSLLGGRLHAPMRAMMLPDSP